MYLVSTSLLAPHVSPSLGHICSLCVGYNFHSMAIPPSLFSPLPWSGVSPFSHPLELCLQLLTPFLSCLGHLGVQSILYITSSWSVYSANPFTAGGQNFPKLSITACTDHGQISIYSAWQQAYQFRTLTLTVGIFGRVARLFHWDRTGCLVTTPINYSMWEGNRQLTEFFLHFDQMVENPEAQRWDPTVTDATEGDVEEFNKAVKATFARPSEPG